METSIGGMLVIGVLLVAIMLMSRTLIVANSIMGTALLQAVEVSGERARTVISIENATSTGTNLTVDINNTGSTSVSDYERMDFIVKYQGNGTQIKRLAYIDGTPVANQWTESITSQDTFQPGIWGPGETITLEAIINPPQQGGTTGTLHVATPNGVTVVGSYTAP